MENIFKDDLEFYETIRTTELSTLYPKPERIITIETFNRMVSYKNWQIEQLLIEIRRLTRDEKNDI